MDFKLDAFPVDDDIGGIRSTEKIKIIICYTLLHTKEALTRDEILSAFYDNAIANYFEISQAVDNLLELDAIRIDDDGNLLLCEKGIKIAKELENELSVYIKNKAIMAAKLTCVYSKRQKENDIAITKLGEKNYELKITIKSGKNADSEKMMSVCVYLTDYFQAQNMKNTFLNNPVVLYQKVIEALTGESEFKV